MSKYIPETDILKPRDPSLDENTDEWPEFALSNVHVHLPGDPDATTSLLEASAGHPVTVTGQLEPLDDEDAHLYIQAPGKKRVNVTIENVYTFSYGQYGDGSTAIWAAGKAGWYTLKPSRNYKQTYESMVEAVNVLYFIADLYREPRKKGKGKNAEILPDYTAKEIFEKYAAEELGSSDPADGQAKIYEHKEFLILSMITEKESLPWTKYPLCKHLVYMKFPEIANKIRKRLAKPVEIFEPSGKAKESKSKQGRQASVDTTASSTSSRRRAGRPRRDPPVHTTSNDSDPESHHPKESRAQPAAKEQTKSRRGGVPTKSRSTRQTPQEEVPEEPSEEEVATPTKDDETDEETKMRARKNKSSLRPRPSKGTKSTARKSGKGPAGPFDDDEEEEPASSPTGGKRKYPDLVESRRPPKRRSSKTHVDEGIDIPTSPSASDAEDDSSSELPGGTSELPLRNLAHVPDPVQEDTWICALDGCSHKVYAASHPDSQRLIKEHYALHAYDDDERVQMVKKLQAPSLPAGHLMERVKQQAKMDGFPGSRQMASRYPETMPGAPVAQKY